MEINAATLHLKNPYSTSCTPTPWEIWTTDEITADTSWDNQPAWLTNEGTSTETSCDDGWVTADATEFFKHAAARGTETATMGLRAVDETDTSQYKQFWSFNNPDESVHPYIEVWYQVPQCSLALDQREGPWTCDGTEADMEDLAAGGVGYQATGSGTQTMSGSVSAAAFTVSAAAAPTGFDQYCPRAGICWAQYATYDSDFHGVGVYTGMARPSSVRQACTSK